MPVILVVDDNQQMAELIQNLVQMEGYTAEVAYSGLEGLDRAREGMPDLILVDLMMPGISGWEMYEKLREFSSIPVIFVTAFDTPQNKARAEAIGAEALIGKETVTSELAHHIQIVLDQEVDPPTESNNQSSPSDREYLH